MREYAKIYTSLWRSRKFTSLESDDARLLYLYLHTCVHSNMVGCFILPDGYATSDLGWDLTRYRQALDSLSAASLVGLNREENVVRIVDFLRHDPFTNKSHAAGALKVAMSLPYCDQVALLFNDLRKSKWVAASAIPTASAQPVERLSTDLRQEQEPEPEPEPISAAADAMREGAEKPDPVKADQWTLREQILLAVGLDTSGLTGRGGRSLGSRADMAEVDRWLQLPGITVPVILEEIGRIMARKRDGPPSSLRFFTRAMQQLSGELSQPPLHPTTPTAAKGSRHGRKQFDAAINHLANQISAGNVAIDHSDRDPFGKRPR